MNIRLLIAVISVTLFACSTSNKYTSNQGFNYEINSLSDSIKDQKFDSILAPYKRDVDAKMNEIIAKSEMALTKDRPESPLTNFVSDLLLEQGRQICTEQKYNFQPDFSLVNHGGLRGTLPKGDIQLKHVFELMPFENEIVFIQISGDQLQILVNAIAIRGGEGVSGLRFGLKNGKGINVLINNKPLKNDATYWLITSDFVAGGGDGMSVLRNAINKMSPAIKVRDVIIRELKQLTIENKMVKATTDGRIYNAE